MIKLEGTRKQNPKLRQLMLKDGRASLYLEYYLGRSSVPVVDEEGNQVYYHGGAMAGKPKYKVKHSRKKENLGLYLHCNPRTSEERLHNRKMIELAEKIRYEREQRFLEDREGYRFRRDYNINFLDYFQNKIDTNRRSKSYRSGFIIALRRFRAFLSETSRYRVYSHYIRPDQLTAEMMSEFADYLKDHGEGSGPQTILHRFKRVVSMALEEGLMRKNPCSGVHIHVDNRAFRKAILSAEEITRLLSTHYSHENSKTQRAFIITLFCGLRFCDVKALTYRNIDYAGKRLSFEQKKTKNRSSNNFVVIPLNDMLIDIIGYPEADSDPDSPIFDLPGYHTCLMSLKKWVRRAGIKKNISWHCGRHSFAVNLLKGGANIKTVQSLLGHSTLEMTSRYLHVIDKDKIDAIDSLGRIDYCTKYNSPGYTAADRLRMREQYPFTKKQKAK